MKLIVSLALPLFLLFSLAVPTFAKGEIYTRGGCDEVGGYWFKKEGVRTCQTTLHFFHQNTDEKSAFFGFKTEFLFQTEYTPNGDTSFVTQYRCWDAGSTQVDVSTPGCITLAEIGY